MALKSYNPTSPGQRGLILVDKSALWKGKPVKALTEGKRKTGGRNNKGHVTSRGIAGGHKQRYRIIDFKRTKDNAKAKVVAIEYDPNRSANIALLHYTDGTKAYILAPKGLTVGSWVESGADADIKVGNALPLKNIPTGTEVHNIELKPGKGGQIARSAGTSAQVLGVDGKYTQVRLQSGEVREILSECRATIGAVGNEQHSLINIGKAGRSRWMGKRPQSRGSVMNPNDHPHGGGEGKAPVGRPQPMTPWGKKSRGVKTRDSKKASEKLIIRHRKGRK